MSRFDGFDLKLLVVLDELLQERSILRASQRLYLSPPAVSNALARLRAVFDDQLLVRQGRHLELTARAEMLAEPLHRIVTQLRELLEQRPTFEPTEAGATFRLAASDNAVGVIVAPLVRRITKSAPNVQLVVRDLEVPDSFDALQGGSLDVVLFASADVTADVMNNLLNSVLGSSHNSAVLYADDWECVSWGPAGIHESPLSPEAFASLAHVAYRMGPSQMPSLAEQHLESCGLSLRVVATTASFVLGPMLVHGTDRVTIIPKRLADLVSPLEDVVTWTPPIDIPPLVETMLWNRRTDADPAHEWLRRVIVEVAAPVASHDMRTSEG